MADITARNPARFAVGYSTNPVADAARYYENLYALQERVTEAIDLAADDFLGACRKADANALAPWAPMTTDWSRSSAPRLVGAPLPKRVQQLHEIMAESLDYGDGPSLAEAMQLVLNVAHGSDLVNAPAQARELLARMAATWAKFNAGEGE